MYYSIAPRPIPGDVASPVLAMHVLDDLVFALAPLSGKIPPGRTAGEFAEPQNE